MNITIGPETLVRFGENHSIIYKAVDGKVKFWPVENKNLLELFPEKVKGEAEILDPIVVGIFPGRNNVGYISLIPEQTVDVLCESIRVPLTLPDTVWVSNGADNFVRMGGIAKEEISSLSLDTTLFALAGPNWVGAFTICFGDDPLPNKPNEIFEEFKRRPFTGYFPDTDLRKLENHDASRTTIRALVEAYNER